jgi:sucrose phosphorylase
MGADLIRLDAVTYIWKELGTPSASLHQTHMIVKLFRDVLDIAAPQVLLVTETNVPHAENISYFGDGSDESQLVYNFALPPLVLHAFYREDATWLSAWAADLEYPSGTTTYLNILDTHDGIGLQGAVGILPAEEIRFLVERAREHGGFISYRSTQNGEEPYEINSTWYSALNLEDSGEPRQLQIHRFVASRSIALALRGIPAVYVHSLNGSRNDTRLALKTKVKRDVNRWTLDFEMLERNLGDPGSKLHCLSEVLTRLFRTRTMHAAFHPNGTQKVLAISRVVFSLFRGSPDGRQHVLCLTNISGSPQDVTVDLNELGSASRHWFDLLAGRGWLADGSRLNLRFNPYDVFWLTPFEEIERVIESRE